MHKRPFKKIVAVLLAGALSFGALFALSSCAGKDGADGRDFSLYGTYLELVDLGEFSGTYPEFVKEYLTPHVEWTEQTDVAESINQNLKTIVQVESTYTSNYTRPSLNRVLSSSAGSAVAIDVDKEKGDAYFVTNCHVIYNSYGAKATVERNLFLYGTGAKDAVPFTVLGYSLSNDIAVIKVTDSEVVRNSELTAAKIGDSDDVFVGDEAFLIGNALGEGISASKGIVSVQSEDTNILNAAETKTITLRSIRTDAAANHGNSGGGFFNAKGELIGILFAGNDNAAGIANCLPINNVMGIANAIIAQYKGTELTSIEKAYLGIEVATSGTRQQIVNGKVTAVDTLTLSKITVGSVVSGKLEIGDVLLKMTAGSTTKDLYHSYTIGEMLWNVKAGDPVVFTVRRGGEVMDVAVYFTAVNMTTVA